MNNETLDRLQALCDAATNGPWVAAVRKQAAASYSETHAAVIGPEYVYADRDKNFCEPDGIFIAESRNAMPALIAEVRRLQAIIEENGLEEDPLVPLRHQPCGCQICVCEDDVQCQGCGAKNCGHHPVGQMPVIEYEDGTKKWFDEDGHCYREAGPIPKRIQDRIDEIFARKQLDCSPCGVEVSE